MCRAVCAVDIFFYNIAVSAFLHFTTKKSLGAVRNLTKRPYI